MSVPKNASQNEIMEQGRIDFIRLVRQHPTTRKDTDVIRSVLRPKNGAKFVEDLMALTALATGPHDKTAIRKVCRNLQSQTARDLLNDEADVDDPSEADLSDFDGFDDALGKFQMLLKDRTSAPLDETPVNSLELPGKAKMTVKLPLAFLPVLRGCHGRTFDQIRIRTGADIKVSSLDLADDPILVAIMGKAGHEVSRAKEMLFQAAHGSVRSF